MTRGRKPLGEKERIMQLIAQIIAERGNEVLRKTGKPSPKKICDILEQEYAVSVTQETMIGYLKEDLDKFNDVELDISKSIILQEINKSIDRMRKLAETATSPSIKIRATNAEYAGLEKRAKIIKILSTAQMAQVESAKPIYIVKFGEPTKIEKEEHDKKIKEDDEDE